MDEWGCVKVKEVDVIWMNTWGILNRTNNMTHSCFSSFLYICIVLTFFFYFKENTIVTTDKEQNKYSKKNIQRCGGQVASNSIWLCPSNKTKFSFFFFLSQFVLKLYPYLVPFTIKGRELTRSLSHFFYFLFFSSSFTEEQKSLLFVFNMDIQILNKYVFHQN